MEEQALSPSEDPSPSRSPHSPHSRPHPTFPQPSHSPSSPIISEYWQQKYRQDAAKNWNLFYRRNQTRFFKDRHWIEREFPELFLPSSRTVLEVGSGVGNFALPLAEANPNLVIYACDFAPAAIELFRVLGRQGSDEPASHRAPSSLFPLGPRLTIGMDRGGVTPLWPI